MLFTATDKCEASFRLLCNATMDDAKIRYKLRRQLSLQNGRDRLIGRTAEESILINAYYGSLTMHGNTSASVVLISGESGMGKTKLAELLRNHVMDDDGFFIRGKFDQLTYGSANLPYTGIASAFGGYCSILEERGGNDWEKIANKLKDEFDADQGKLLVEAIPSLKKIVEVSNDQAIVASLTRNEEAPITEGRAHQLCFLLKKFIRVISSTGDPIVFLIDDMQVRLCCRLQILLIFTPYAVVLFPLFPS